MMIKQTAPSLAAGNVQKSASNSAPQAEGFSAELKKKLSADKPQDKDSLPTEIKKKPVTKDLKLADAPTDTAAVNPLPVTLSADSAQLNPLPATLAADAALALPQAVQPQDALAQEPALQGELPGVSAAQAPAAQLAAVAGTELASTAPTTVSRGESVLLSDAVSTSAPQDSHASPLAAKLHLAKPAAEKATAQAAGVEKPVVQENTDTAKISETTSQQVAASENIATKLHAAVTAEPLQAVHSAHVSAPVSQTSLPVTTEKVATGALQAEVGTPAWQQSLGQQIAVFTRDGIHHAELRLHPEELGSLQISLRLNNDQAQLHFVTGDHQVRAALESAMPHLRTQLEESGIQLGQSSVGAESSSSTGDAQSGEGSGQGKSDQEASELTVLTADEQILQARVMKYSSGINTFA